MWAGDLSPKHRYQFTLPDTPLVTVATRVSTVAGQQGAGVTEGDLDQLRTVAVHVDTLGRRCRFWNDIKED